MADLDLKVQLQIVDKASAQLKKFNKELEKTRKNIEAVSKTNIKTPTTGGSSGGGVSASGGIGAGAATALGVGGASSVVMLQKIASSATLVAGGIKLLTETAFVYSLASERMNTKSEALNVTLKYLRENFGEVASEVNNEVEAINKSTAATKKSSKATKEHQGSTDGLVARLGKVRLAFAAVAAVITASIGVAIKQASVYENLQAKLRSVVKPGDDVAGAFELIKDTAAQLPTTVDETAEAFIRMNALGIVPTQERMIAFGNIASAMGKSILQFAEAAADASVGEFERLKEFGIKARSEGDKVALTFQNNTVTIGKNSTEIIKYLEEIGKSKFGGAASLQMDTLTGKTSNLGQAWDDLKAVIGEGVLLDAAKFGIDVLTDAVKWVTELVYEFDHFRAFLADEVVSAWMGLKHAFQLVTTYIDITWQKVVNSMERAWTRTINRIKEGWNSIADTLGLDAFADIERVPPKVRDLDQAMQDLKKTQAEERAEHDRIIASWKAGIPTAEDRKKRAQEYNEVLKQRAIEQEKAAEQAKKDAAALELLNEQIKEGKKLMEEMRTPIEVYRDTIKDLGAKLKSGAIDIETFNRAVKAAKDEASGGLFGDTRTQEEQLAATLDTYDQLLAEGIITWDTYSRAVFDAWDSIEEETEKSTDKMSEFAVAAARSMQQSFSDFFFDIMQGNFNDLVGSFKRTLDRMVADMLASQLSSFLFGDFGKTGSIGGLASKAGSFLTGLIGRASGGPMVPGEAYQLHAGEVIVPQIPQYVYPSKPAFAEAMGGGGQNINVSINAIDSQSFRDMVERDDRWFVDTISDASRRYNKGSF